MSSGDQVISSPLVIEGVPLKTHILVPDPVPVLLHSLPNVHKERYLMRLVVSYVSFPIYA